MGGVRCWSNLDPPHLRPCPRGIPRTEGQTSPLLGPFQWGWSYFFIHLFFTDNGDVWALPPTCQSCPGPAPLLRNTPPTLCLPLLVRRTPGPHPTPGYVFKVNGFRCEHLVLTVALYIFCGGVGWEGGVRGEGSRILFLFSFFKKKEKGAGLFLKRCLGYLFNVCSDGYFFFFFFFNDF